MEKIFFEGKQVRVPNVKFPQPLSTHNPLPKIGRYCTIVSSIFTFIVGVVHMCGLMVNLSFPGKNNNFIDDTNKGSFRLAMFSFSPTVFIDCWTPMVFCLLGLAMHVQQLNWTFISKNFLRYSIFHLLMILFGNFAYAGGVGIIFGILNFVMWPLFVFLSIYAPNESVSLNVFFGHTHAPKPSSINQVNAQNEKISHSQM